MDLLGELPEAQAEVAPAGAATPEPAHYPHGPSSAHRWLNCPGSINAEAGCPDVTTDAADEGTAAHWLLEQCLLNFPKSVEDYLGAVCKDTKWMGQDDHGLTHARAGIGMKTVNDAKTMYIKAGDETGCVKEWPITGEMVEAVQLALNEIDEQAGKKGALLWVEARVRLDDALELAVPVGGTCDVRVWLPRSKALYVWDFKYGRGHVVEADDNEQNDMYALGAIYAFEEEFEGKRRIEKVIRGIIQPRAKHKKGPVRYAKPITPGELQALREDQIKAKVKESLDPNAPRIPGEKQCNFCKAKSGCKEHAEWRSAAATGEFTADGEGEVAGPTPKGVIPTDSVTNLQSSMNVPVTSLPAETLAKVKDALPALKAWIAEVEKEAKTRLEHGISLPGYRLGMGRGSRQWAGTDMERAKAAEALISAGVANRADLYEPATFKSVAQIEKAVGAKAFRESPLATFVSHVAGGPVVVEKGSDKPDYTPPEQREFQAEVEPAAKESNALLGDLPGSHLL